MSLEILSLRPINVDEGKRAALGEHHINIILDIARFGLNESSVMLAVLTPPVHGTLHLDKAPIIAGKTRFTLYDVYQHRVSRKLKIKLNCLLLFLLSNYFVMNVLKMSETFLFMIYLKNSLSSLN